MIVSKNISPQHDVYYLGAKLIELLSNSKKKKTRLLQPSQAICEGMPYFVQLISVSLRLVVFVRCYQEC